MINIRIQTLNTSNQLLFTFVDWHIKIAIDLQYEPFLLLLYLESSQNINIFQMGEQAVAKQKYLKIIKQLERPYDEKAGDDKLQEFFKIRVSKEFKLEVTCDSELEVAIHQYYKECHKTFFSTQLFSNKLKFIQKMNQIFRNIQFISRRQFYKMNEILNKQIHSPANKWVQGIIYLKSSKDLEEFRSQFLVRYCNFDEDQVEEILQNDSIQNLKVIKKQYQDFFTKSLQEGVNPKIINFIEDIFCQFESKSTMLSASLIKLLQSKLGISQIGSDDNEIKINQQLRKIAQQNAYNNDQEAQQRLEDQIKLLEKAFRKFSGLNIFRQKKMQLRLGKFGSLTSGFAGIDADLDLTILTNCYINQIQLLRLLYEFLRKEYKGDDTNRGSRRIGLQFIQHAKTPLLQVIINQRGKVQVKIDIIVNNILGIINSKFLSVYSSVKWIKNLGILVKMWGKNQNLIGKNYLSSYAMILMLIHYLIKVKKVNPILDNRVITQQKPFFEYKRLKQAQIEKFKVYYAFKKEAKDVTVQQRANYYKILTGFMQYYAYQFWKQDERNRIITVDQSQREVDKECAITIKDPFDEPHNPGRIKADSQDFLKIKFQGAYQILKKGDQGKIAQLFLVK